MKLSTIFISFSIFFSCLSNNNKRDESNKNILFRHDFNSCEYSFLKGEIGEKVVRIYFSQKKLGLYRYYAILYFSDSNDPIILSSGHSDFPIVLSGQNSMDKSIDIIGRFNDSGDFKGIYIENEKDTLSVSLNTYPNEFLLKSFCFELEDDFYNLFPAPKNRDSIYIRNNINLKVHVPFSDKQDEDGSFINQTIKSIVLPKDLSNNDLEKSLKSNLKSFFESEVDLFALVPNLTIEKDCTIIPCYTNKNLLSVMRILNVSGHRSRTFWDKKAYSFFINTKHRIVFNDIFEIGAKKVILSTLKKSISNNDKYDLDNFFITNQGVTFIIEKPTIPNKSEGFIESHIFFSYKELDYWIKQPFRETLLKSE